jgi:hypothetical protein
MAIQAPIDEMAPPPSPITSQPAASQHAGLRLSPLGMVPPEALQVQCHSALDEWDLRGVRRTKRGPIYQRTARLQPASPSLNPKHGGRRLAAIRLLLPEV